MATVTTTSLSTTEVFRRKPLISTASSPKVKTKPLDSSPVVKKQMSTPVVRRRRQSNSQPCQSFQPLDASTIQALASMRLKMLSYVAELETQLSTLESPDMEEWRLKGEVTMEDAKQRLNTTLKMLESIRADVSSHIPDIPDFSVENLKSHFPEVPSMEDVRSHLPDVMPNLMDMRSKLDDIRARYNELDFHAPLTYVSTLFDHMETLDSHLSSVEFPFEFDISAMAPSVVLSDMLDAILGSDLFAEMASDIKHAEDSVEQTARDVSQAVKRSLDGVRLISYSELPNEWRNNPFVTEGYRFIPIERWPLIILSLFAFHNETLNIHTHLIPFVHWLVGLIPIFKPAHYDIPEMLYVAFALLCLFSSTLSHVMAGCSDKRSMEFWSRVDYVGIGWLISASVATVVHYSFQCNPVFHDTFLWSCAACGVAGTIFPFMAWFNDYKYRHWRVAFFLSLAFSSLAPMAIISNLHSTRAMLHYISPIVPSFISYIVGLVFYVSHFPERFLSATWSKRLDRIGGGSHAIWHCFIVLAVYQHKTGIELMKGGFGKCHV